MAPPKKRKKKPDTEPEGIIRIAVQGFKSIAEETSIDVRPLTILAGPNSSGKSSIMQPLLMMKQTLEAPYDPGPLLISGPHVTFAAVHEFLTRCGPAEHRPLVVRVEDGPADSVEVHYAPEERRGLTVYEMKVRQAGEAFTLRPGMTHAEIESVLPPLNQAFVNGLSHDAQEPEWRVEPSRGLLEARFAPRGQHPSTATGASARFVLCAGMARMLERMIHVPGLRDNRERAYPRTAPGPNFPGPFDPYTASVIEHWQDHSRTGDTERGTGLAEDLKQLGLTSSVRAQRRDDASLEVLVGRLPVGSPHPDDEVNVADVGLGVSQVLPALVALRAGDPGRLVYVEQPEIHLHPRAQVALAGLLVDAAKRGVRVVAETHSDLVVLGIRRMVAERRLDPALVRLHWFERGPDGVTRVTSGDLDETGAWGDWPEDFADVRLDEQTRYLEAAEARLLG